MHEDDLEKGEDEVKVGILTFIHTSNYGAAFQAYALQRLIEDQDVQCELINYTSPTIYNHHNPTAATRIRKDMGLLYRITSPLAFLMYATRQQKFERFTTQNCKMSDERYDGANISQIACKYDRIVVGSDQVWNTKLTCGDESFFLPFAASVEQRCSYAASFGEAYLSEDGQERWENLLRMFSVLSVREASGQRVLQQRMERSVKWDLDPTLLLPQEQWRKFTTRRPSKRDYIFVYMIPETPEVLDAIRQLAADTGCNIRYARKGIRRYAGMRILNAISPERFLNEIYHAKYVVAGSFHALCLSLVYEKQFFYTEASRMELSVRLTDLLEALQLKDRKLRTGRQMKQEISYQKVNEKLDQMRASSMQTIRLICGTNRNNSERI